MARREIAEDEIVVVNAQKGHVGNDEGIVLRQEARAVGDSGGDKSLFSSLGVDVPSQNFV